MKGFSRLIVMFFIIEILILTNTVCVHAEEYEYDALNRVTKVMYEDGSYVEYEYDSNGNILNVNVYNAKPTDREDEEESSGEPDKPSEENKEESEQSEARKFVEQVIETVKEIAKRITQWFWSWFS